MYVRNKKFLWKRTPRHWTLGYQIFEILGTVHSMRWCLSQDKRSFQKTMAVKSSILTINLFLQQSPSCEANSYGTVQNISSFSGYPKSHSHFIIDRIKHFTLYCTPLVLKEELFSREIFIKPSCLANMPPSTEEWRVGELLFQTLWVISQHTRTFHP